MRVSDESECGKCPTHEKIGVEIKQLHKQYLRLVHNFKHMIVSKFIHIRSMKCVV